MAAVKRGAGPNSPMLTADVSSVSTQPAPIRRSACSDEVGKATTCSRFTPRRISARVAAMATPDTSRGTASMQPSVIAGERFIERADRTHDRPLNRNSGA